MIEIEIPGFGPLHVDFVVLDYNGTLAVDGLLLPGAAEALRQVSKHLEIHVVTADTFGKVRSQMAELPVTVSILPSENMQIGKLNYVKTLGLDRTVTIGNGRNDREMLKHSALGICVIQGEGAAAETMANSRIVTTNIVVALELLLNPLRLIATLRS